MRPGFWERRRTRPLYDKLAADIRAAFNREFYNPKTGDYADGTQTANTLPLFLGLATEKEGGAWGRLFDDIVYKHDSHLTTGIIGTKYIMELLTRNGAADLAYDIAVQTTYPSWGYMIENGATTLWELWQKREGPSMNSHNHPMFGSVGAWLYKALAGITMAPGTVGYEKLILQPQMVRDLKHASGSIDTLRGEVGCTWSRTDGSVRRRGGRAGRVDGRDRHPQVQPAARQGDGGRPGALGERGVRAGRRGRRGRGRTRTARSGSQSARGATPLSWRATNSGTQYSFPNFPGPVRRCSGRGSERMETRGHVPRSVSPP